jgi:hypothetical protein
MSVVIPRSKAKALPAENASTAANEATLNLFIMMFPKEKFL